MVSQDRPIHPCKTDSENTNLLVSRSSQSQHGLVLFPPARQKKSSLIDGFLKYKNREKPKTGPRPGPARIWTMTWKLARSPGRKKVWTEGLKCRDLALVLPTPKNNKYHNYYIYIYIYIYIYSGYGKYSDPLKFFTLCYIAAIC